MTNERRSFLEPDEILRIHDEWWSIFEVEDAIYVETDFTRTVAPLPAPAPLAAGGTAAFFQVQNLEPDQIEEYQTKEGLMMTRINQWLVGVNVDNIFVYMELLSGDIKRGTARQPRPVVGNNRIAYFDYRSSPDIAPKVEFWLFHNQFPSFSIFNNNGFQVANVLLYFVGRKYTLLEANKDTHPEFFKRMKLGLNPPHRRITLRGLNSEYTVSPTEVR